MIFNIIIYLTLGFIITKKDCVKINILSNNAAFIKYDKNQNYREIIFKQPLNDKLKLSATFGNIHISKELERSKYKSTIFVDKHRLSMKSNLDQDNFAVNSICKFDYEQLTAYTFDRVCCQITLRHRNVTLDRKICKLEVSITTSVCFLQLEVNKKMFDFNNKDEHELTMTSRVFSSADSKCSPESVSGTHLAQGLPQKIIITQGLQVKWMVTDLSKTFGKLEIGIPVDSVEVLSKTIFPLRIKSAKKISSVEIECSYGSDLLLSMISFEATNFGGEFIPSKKAHLVRILLQQVDRSSSSNWSPSQNEPLVNLEMSILSESSFSRRSQSFNNWISCRVTGAKFAKSKLVTIRNENESNSKQVPLKINVDGFVIIPITTDKTYFSVLNEISGPIMLQKNDLKMFSVHNIRDGSLVDITMKTHCSPMYNSSILCPSEEVNNIEKTILLDPNWNIFLSMQSWQKLLTYPIDLWHAEDWRTVIQDKTLNQIKNWRYSDGKSKKCRSVYQRSRCQLLARFLKDSPHMQEEYFGQRKTDDFPLFDLTSHVHMSNIRMSSSLIDVTLKDNVILLSPLTAGESDISIVNSKGKIVGFDRIMVDDELVTVSDLQVSCIHRLNVTQSSNHFNPSFRSIIVQPQPSRNVEEVCYFKIKLVFSDNSVTDIQDYLFTDLQIILRTAQESILIKDLDSFVYEPSKYKEPGKFSISIYESATCSKNKLILEKKVYIFNSSKVDETFSKNALTTTSSQISLSSINTSNTIIKETAKIIQTTKDPKGIDMDSLFLSMKILIGLVALVVLIVILNCVIKIRQRKSLRLIDRPLNHSSAYSPIEKLTASTYTPVDITSQNQNLQHPPLLPPPGPLYNASNSSQLDLTVNATPDIFWGLPHGAESMGRNSRITFQMNQINGYQNMHLQNRKHSPSPHSDNLDYGFVIANTNKMPCNSQNVYNFPPESNQDTDSVATGSSGKNCSQITMHVPPPCPPLRWNNNFCSNQFAMCYPCSTDVTTELSQNSHENSSQNSLSQSHASSWEVKQKPVLPPSAFSNSIDNVCEKSSGVGSLTSTKPESDCSKKDSGCPSSPKTADYSILH